MAKATSDRVTAGDVQDLAVAVEQLSEETRLLRMSLDELRDDVVWAARQALAAGDDAAPGRLRRQYDPLAPDSHGDDQREEPVVEHAMDDEGSESPEDGPYCCDKPQLTWHGDPDAPGIACAHCGYVVAEMGSVVIWRGEPEPPRSEASAPPAPPDQKQGSLFH